MSESLIQRAAATSSYGSVALLSSFPQARPSSFPRLSSVTRTSPSNPTRFGTPSRSTRLVVYSDGLSTGFRRRSAMLRDLQWLSVRQKRFEGQHVRILVFPCFLRWMSCVQWRNRANLAAIVPINGQPMLLHVKLQLDPFICSLTYCLLLPM